MVEPHRAGDLKFALNRTRREISHSGPTSGCHGSVGGLSSNSRNEKYSQFLRLDAEVAVKPSFLIVVMAAALSMPAAAQVASIAVTPASGAIVAGKTLQLNATAKDASGNVVAGTQLIWLSGPFEIAAVDQKGLVRAFRQGSLKILARAGGKVGTAEFTVLPKPAVKVSVTA